MIGVVISLNNFFKIYVLYRWYSVILYYLMYLLLKIAGRITAVFKWQQMILSDRRNAALSLDNIESGQNTSGDQKTYFLH